MSIDHSRPVIISAQELLARGYSRRAREHAERTGQLYRVRHGVYALASDLPTGPNQAEAMLEIRSRAAAGSISPGTALSHTSALVLHGLPVHDLDTRRVTTTRHRPGSGSRRGRSSICHNLDLADAVTEVDGIPVTTPARTIVDVARSSPFTGAVCAADEALRRELCSPAELADELDAAAGRVGIARARAVVAFADAGAQSVLESVSRVVISRAGLPMPQLQREFILPDGTSVFVDMYWEEWGLVGEADGTGKYGIDDGEESVRQKLRDEKKRQNDIESLGNIVRRWQWEDYQRGRIVPVIREAMRIQESLGRGPGRAA
ncbi:type IV toxin-antitoxin system AbiEi family antitoxin domain-containing protein [Dietzia sp. CH92]|uniref:type IV toxin-antitoxin system AbiEi family antitoxin domain-containing protein n=1 Tax=Dietzia sp. CH92 TaxID=3051823 RepID=UPI0028D6EA6F|nr:hypothetical protein [Dietzia sp. CH92]